MAAQWKFAFIVGIVLIASATAHVMRRDVATQAENEHIFSKLFEDTKGQLQSFEQNFAKALGFNSPEELRAKASDQGKALATSLDSWATGLKGQTEALKENSAVKELRSTIDKAVNDFKANNPETTADFEKFLESAKTKTGEIFQEIKNVGEKPEVKELAEKLLASSAQAFQEIGSKIGESLKQ